MNTTKLRSCFDRLEAERKTLDSTLEVIRKFFVPFRGEFFRDMTSEHEVNWRDMRQVYDTTGIAAADRLAANVQSALTSPSTQWFKFKFRKEEMNEDYTARTWLEDCEQRVYQELQESNFDEQSSEFYLDAVSFGTAVLSEEVESETGPWKGINFAAIPLVDVYFEEDTGGDLINFYRKHMWTALQICDKFGDKNVPPNIISKRDSGASEKIKVILAVYKRPENEGVDTGMVLAENKRPFGWKYFIHSDSEMIGKEGGYYEMPAFIARWRKVSGSKWGYSPAHIALSDVLTLNQITEDTLEALGKVIDPAILTTKRGLLSDLDLRRSGVTVVKDTKDLVPFESRARFDVGELKTERLQAAIRSAFYVDQLELKESPAMTATEVNARADMVLKLMGPTTGRMQNDYLDPLLKRTFSILMRAKRLSEIPPIVKEMQAEMDIEYTGPMPRAQRQDLILAVNSWVAGVAAVAEVNQEILDIPDWDEIARETARLAGIPTRLTRDDKGVKKARKERDEAMKRQQEAEVAKTEGEAMKATGEGQQALQVVGGEQ